MSDDIHSCSPYCDRPACVKEQRDKMRDAMAGDDVKMLEPVEVYVGIYAYTADQMREYADAKCAELRRRIAELEQSADLHYKSHAAAIAKLAESEKRVAELDADARRLDLS
jgi:CMP-2-keto-3-deoxyoctulosonic acid synthetase